MWRLFLLQNLLKKRQLACIISLLAWQHDDNKNLDSPYFADNLNTPDNVCKNTHTKLFKLPFSGASGNDFDVVKNPVFMRILTISEDKLIAHYPAVLF